MCAPRLCPMTWTSEGSTPKCLVKNLRNLGHHLNIVIFEYIIHFRISYVEKFILWQLITNVVSFNIHEINSLNEYKFGREHSEALFCYSVPDVPSKIDWSMFVTWWLAVCQGCDRLDENFNIIDNGDSVDKWNRSNVVVEAEVLSEDETVSGRIRLKWVCEIIVAWRTDCRVRWFPATAASYRNCRKLSEVNFRRRALNVALHPNRR